MRIHIDDVPKSVLVSSGMTATVVIEALPRQWATLAVLRAWRAAAPLANGSLNASQRRCTVMALLGVRES